MNTNTTFLHAHALNLGNGKVSITLNVSTTGGSERSAIACFQAAARTFYKREIGEDICPATHEIRLLASRPAAETQRIINAVNRYAAGSHKGVFVENLRQNRYNVADAKRKQLYCPDTLAAIRGLVKLTRGW